MRTQLSNLAVRTGSSTARLARLSFVLLPLLLAASGARAQFNGPATSSVGAELNRPTSITTDQSLLYPVEHDQVLTVGDEVQVHIFNQPEYVPIGRIGANGNILLPLIGEIKLAGLSISEAEVHIAHALDQAGMYRDPAVTLTVTEGPNTAATMIGEMHGVVPIIGSRPLLEVLSAAGGLPPTASHVITINRPGSLEPIVVDLGSDPLHSARSNVPIFPGDTVIVARIGVVYMVGQFKNPGVINLTPYAPLTLMQASALTGGLAFDAKPHDVRIIRTIGDKRTVVKLDASAVFYGKAPDPILQPNDIVFVPQSGLKLAIEQGGLGTLIGAVSLAVTAIAIARQ
ncbi:polysaccharide export outer membrane protein [Bryocella elongata]|uniref:Polysaccharide export outer membrane protein n=1 Tax=Bryocella elongata TaxID=863522 RepID=A0A1H5Z6T5_9BACT|nr:polysaccharide biosynthesis/export family protein [Bryocella elongata]SEG32108.1 polysaccharide export outer membrane protein [Bryocella elongata]